MSAEKGWIGDPQPASVWPPASVWGDPYLHSPCPYCGAATKYKQWQLAHRYCKGKRPRVAEHERSQETQ